MNTNYLSRCWPVLVYPVYICACVRRKHLRVTHLSTDRLTGQIVELQKVRLCCCRHPPLGSVDVLLEAEEALKQLLFCWETQRLWPEGRSSGLLVTQQLFVQTEASFGREVCPSPIDSQYQTGNPCLQRSWLAVFDLSSNIIRLISKRAHFLKEFLTELYDSCSNIWMFLLFVQKHPRMSKSFSFYETVLTALQMFLFTRRRYLQWNPTVCGKLHS